MHASPSIPSIQSGGTHLRWVLARVALAALLVLVGVTAPAAAQDGDAPVEPADISASGDNEIQIVEVNSDSLPRVDVVLAVPPDFAGQLPAAAFGLTEAGQVRAVEVVKLEEVIEVVIVIDTSGSMRGAPIAAAKQAAQDFVNALDGNTRIGVVGFGATAETVADFNDDRAATLAAIDALEANGETALYDAIVLGTSEFGSSDARRFAIVLSDGNDTVSTLTQQDASAALSASDSTFYAITLVSNDANFTALEAITGAVEGELIAATDASLGQVYDNVASRISNLYRLSYDSGVDGEHRVVISLQLGEKLAFASDDLIFTAAPGDSGSNGPSTPIETGVSTVETRTAPGGLLQSENALYIGAGIIFMLIASLVFFAMARQPSGPSAFSRLNLPTSVGNKRPGNLSDLTDRATAVADRILDRGEKRGALDAVLEKAGIEMRPAEFILTSFFGSLGLGFVTFIFKGPLIGGGAILGGLVFSRMYVNFKAGRRKKKFADQLGGTLMMIAGSMRAGHGIVEAIDTVASQGEAPTGEEFSRAVAEARIGRDMVESLYDIASRTESEDFIWVVRAISINRELGGDLAEILDNVGETIRDRNRLRDQVRALSAEGKVSAMILFALPVLVAGWVRLSNPDYMRSMTDETAGKFLGGFAVMLLLTGGIWLKKLVNVDF